MDRYRLLEMSPLPRTFQYRAITTLDVCFERRLSLATVIMIVLQ